MPDIFPILEHSKAGYEGELHLTDSLDRLVQDGHAMLAYEFEGKYLDTRSKLGYLRATLEFAQKDPETAMVLRSFCANIT
jgi:UTP--glucose-1-phosphate uridylyltransferase